MSESVTELISYKAVCRTAPATPGPFKITGPSDPEAFPTSGRMVSVVKDIVGEFPLLQSHFDFGTFLRRRGGPFDFLLYLFPILLRRGEFPRRPRLEAEFTKATAVLSSVRVSIRIPTSPQQSTQTTQQLPALPQPDREDTCCIIKQESGKFSHNNHCFMASHPPGRKC